MSDSIVISDELRQNLPGSNTLFIFEHLDILKLSQGEKSIK
jgi:hypothetical protein